MNRIAGVSILLSCVICFFCFVPFNSTADMADYLNTGEEDALKTTVCSLDTLKRWYTRCWKSDLPCGDVTDDGICDKDDLTAVIEYCRDPDQPIVSKLPDTGQTMSYTDTFGEDSDYSINPPSYTKLNDAGEDLDVSATVWAMVRDDVTGLIWEVKTRDGGIHDNHNTYTWQACKDVFIYQLNSDEFGGYSDWRMPTVYELSTLRKLDQTEPAINKIFFPYTMPKPYYSSMESAGWFGNAWYVNFLGGTVFMEASRSYEDGRSSLRYGRYARAVRGKWKVIGD